MYLLKGLFREYVFIKGTVSEFQVTLEIMPTAQSMGDFQNAVQCVYISQMLPNIVKGRRRIYQYNDDDF